jgi:hypothetical protein
MMEVEDTFKFGLLLPLEMEQAATLIYQAALVRVPTELSSELLNSQGLCLMSLGIG